MGTTQNELQAIISFMPYIKSLAKRFRQYEGDSRFSEEDLVQEAVLACLVWLRKRERPEGLIPILDIKHAMTRVVMKNYGLSTLERGQTFSSAITKMRELADEKRNAITCQKSFEEDLVGCISLQRYIEELDADSKEILRSKLQGMTFDEIAAKRGVTKQAICNRMRRIIRNYHKMAG